MSSCRKNALHNLTRTVAPVQGRQTTNPPCIGPLRGTTASVRPVFRVGDGGSVNREVRYLRLTVGGETRFARKGKNRPHVMAPEQAIPMPEAGGRRLSSGRSATG